MRPLKFILPITLIALVSVTAHAQGSVCQWQTTAVSPTPYGDVTIENCIISGQTSAAERVYSFNGTCAITVHSGFQNLYQCENAVIISDGSSSNPSTPICYSGDTWTYQTGPGRTGDPNAAQACGGTECGYSVEPVHPGSFPLLRYTCN